MSTILCYRGRTVTADDLETIRALFKAHPEASRRAFSQRLCEHWDWRQPNGALRDMVCRSLLLVLHRAEHICLPAVRHRPLDPSAWMPWNSTQALAAAEAGPVAN